MLTLIGDTTITVKNPKVGNLETIDSGVALKTTRQGSVSGIISGVDILRRRFDFQWLTNAEKIQLENWILAHIGRVITVQWSRGGNCNTSTINEQYIIDDQTLEIITVHDGCSYDCMTFWIKV
jgi:hypothetical protein